VDAKLILGEIKNKNHFVFKKLFDDLYLELVTHANGYLFDKASSEDIVQDVFIWLWEKSDKIHLKTTLKGYLYIMVRNRCLNKLKALKITDTSKILEIQAIFLVDHAEDWFPDEDKEVCYQNAFNIMEKLPAKMRAIVELRFKNNCRYKEIAEELNISINTVKTQLKRAKVKLEELTVSLLLLFSML
jgi:RNA polymerase sigma-70 factor (ECF subfamily)